MRLQPQLIALALVPALLPAGFNAGAATRRHIPDARLAADFAYDLLNTAPPYGILFTYGDNDTFPLWWAQEVAGMRRDVTVVCIALTYSSWYPRQLRDQPVRAFDSDRAAPLWRGADGEQPDGPLHTMSDAELESLVAQRIERPLTVDFGGFGHTYPAGTVFDRSDVVAIRIIQQNLDRRPVVWSVTAGREFAGLSDYIVQQGLAFRIEREQPDDADPGLYFAAGAPPLDVALTRRLVDETYRYADLEHRTTETPLEPTAGGIARTLGFPLVRLAEAEAARGDSLAARDHLARAARIARGAPGGSADR
jgi:hypothetical protein